MTSEQLQKLYGKRALIKNITSLGDTDLNGKTGILCKKHFMRVNRDPLTVLGDIGIVLDQKIKLRYANLDIGEFELIGGK